MCFFDLYTDTGCADCKSRTLNEWVTALVLLAWRVLFRACIALVNFALPVLCLVPANKVSDSQKLWWCVCTLQMAGTSAAVDSQLLCMCVITLDRVLAAYCPAFRCLSKMSTLMTCVYGIGAVPRRLLLCHCCCFDDSPSSFLLMLAH